MSDAEMITILVLFHSTTFRNFKHFYLFYVCREPKEEFPNLLSYTRFVERMPRVADRGIHIVTGIRTNMKNRLMDEYDKKGSVKEALSRPSTICSRTWRRLFILDTEVSQTLLSTFWQGWRLMLSTIQNLLSIWSLRWREKQR